MAVSAALAGARHVHALERILLEGSGFPIVEQWLTQFGERADVLKVARSVTSIEALAYDAQKAPTSGPAHHTSCVPSGLHPSCMSSPSSRS